MVSPPSHPLPQQLASSSLFLRCALLAICTNFFEAFSSSYPASSNAAFLAFFNNSYIDRGQSAGVAHVVLQCFWTISLYAAPFGNLLGFVLAPVCTWKYGPRNSILVANAYALVASLISSAALVFEFPELLLLARLIASSAASVGLIALLLFLQLIPWPSQRGRFSFLCPFSISAIEFGALLLNFFRPHFGQNLLALVAVAILPQLVGIFLALKMYETPHFLLLKFGNREKATKALQFYRGNLSESQIEEELARIVRAHQAECANNHSHCRLKALFGQRHRRLAALLGFCVLQMTVGGWPVLESSTEILAEHFGNSFAQVASFLLLIGYFLSSLVGLYSIDKIPRRPLVLFSALANALSLLLFVLFDRLGHFFMAPRLSGALGLPFLLLFAASLGSLLGPISYFLAAELLPLCSPLSSLLLSALFSLNILSTFFFSWATPPLFRLAHSWVFLPLYLLPSLLCLLPLYFLLPETVAREKVEIVKEIDAK